MHRHVRLAGVVLAVIAWIATLVLPVYSTATEQAGPDGTMTSTEGTATLIEINGWGAAIPGLILVALAVGVWLAPVLVARWICLAVFLVLTALLMASIGLFFFPAAILLILGVSMDRGADGDGAPA